jgi:hypothetical protein
VQRKSARVTSDNRQVATGQYRQSTHKIYTISFFLFVIPLHRLYLFHLPPTLLFQHLLHDILHRMLTVQPMPNSALPIARVSQRVTSCGLVTRFNASNEHSSGRHKKPVGISTAWPRFQNMSLAYNVQLYHCIYLKCCQFYVSGLTVYWCPLTLHLLAVYWCLPTLHLLAVYWCQPTLHLLSVYWCPLVLGCN